MDRRSRLGSERLGTSAARAPGAFHAIVVALLVTVLLACLFQ